MSDSATMTDVVGWLKANVEHERALAAVATQESLIVARRVRAGQLGRAADIIQDLALDNRALRDANKDLRWRLREAENHIADLTRDLRNARDKMTEWERMHP